MPGDSTIDFGSTGLFLAYGASFAGVGPDVQQHPNPTTTQPKPVTPSEGMLTSTYRSVGRPDPHRCHR